MSKDESDKNEEKAPEDTSKNKAAESEPDKNSEQKSEEAVPEKKRGRVCITYGRDKIMNRQVVSLVKELGINPIVMQDKDNRTKSVAQFFTENQDVAFVIAILSADDWVYPKNGKPNDALMYADQRTIFHLGFWIGRLGRNRVFALYYDQRSFRWPTEHFDVIYTPLDRNGLWKKELVSRLTAGGIEFSDTPQNC